MSFSNIYFILHKPQLSENIGACARALKNFNFRNLILINPKVSFPNDKILATSVGAKDVVKKSKIFEKLEVWLGQKDKIGVYTKEDIYKTVPKARKKYLKAIIKYDGPILAPIKKDEIVGKFKVFYKDDLINEYNLYASEDIKKVNMFSRILKSINFIIWGDV